MSNEEHEGASDWLTDEQLYEIRDRWILRHKARVVNVYGQAELFRKWLDVVGDDETALLDEIDRLRAENARLTAQVADERADAAEQVRFWQAQNIALGETISGLRAQNASLIIAREVCGVCGHAPCDCAAYMAADDALYGWTCSDCGARLQYEGAWHECVDVGGGDSDDE